VVNASSDIALSLEAVSCPRNEGGSVRAVSADFAAARFHILRGDADGGRDLLLRVIGLLQPPDEGEVLVLGQPTRSLSEEARAQVRTQSFGFVFAAPFLLTAFTVIENVAMPLFKISQVSPEEARRRTGVLLDLVGLADAAEVAVDDLTLRAQYQVAVARGLVNEPAFLIVEQLDGALAGDDLRSFMEVLHRVCETFGTTIIASASPSIMPAPGDRVIEIADGAIAFDSDLLREIEG
jgi:ABC-type lipoprotein export system ATPase subunit